MKNFFRAVGGERTLRGGGGDDDGTREETF
jgi:hypothetical protein